MQLKQSYTLSGWKWVWNIYQILDSCMLLRHFKEGLKLNLKSQRKLFMFLTCRCFSSWSSSWLHRSTSTCLGCRRVQRCVGRGCRNHRPSWWEPPGWGSTPPATKSWKSPSACPSISGWPSDTLTFQHWKSDVQPATPWVLDTSTGSDAIRMRNNPDWKSSNQCAAAQITWLHLLFMAVPIFCIANSRQDFSVRVCVQKVWACDSVYLSLRSSHGRKASGGWSNTPNGSTSTCGLK